MKELLIVLEQLRRQKVRTALLVGSIALAFAAFAVLGSLRYSLNSGDDAVSQSRLIVTHQAGLMEPLPLAHLAQMQALPGVDVVGHATWLGAYFQDQRQMLMVFAVQPQAWIAQHPDMVLEPGVAEAFYRQRDGMLVSRALAQKYGWKVGDVVPLGSILFEAPGGEPAWRLRVVGLFTSADSGGGRNYIVSHYDYLNEGRTLWRNTVGTYMLTAKPGYAVQTLANAVDAFFASSAAPTSSNTDQAFHAEFFKQFGDVSFMIKAVIAAAFVSLVLVVASTLALAVRQGSRDIGVLKVLGYSHGRVLALVFWQSGALVLLGAALGLAAGAAINHLVTSQLPQFLPDILLPLPVLGEALAIVAVLALLTGALPALLALRIRPLEAFSVEQG
jgi:putative ABC transport system permease protein